MFVTEILVFTLALLIARHFWINRRFYYLAYKLPRSSFDWSIKGVYRALTSDNKAVFEMVHEAFNNTDVCCKTWLGPLFCGVIRPDDIKKVLNSKHCMDKPYFIKFMRLYKGSLFGDVEYWQSHRKIMNPYFGTQALRDILPIFNQRSKVLVKNLSEMEGKGEFDVLHFMTALTLETIMRVMEYEIDLQNMERKSRDVFIENLVDFLKIVTLRIYKVWLHPDLIFRYTSLSRIHDEAEKKCTFGLAGEMLQNIRQKVENESNNNNDSNVKPRNFIRALIHPKNQLDDSELIDEIKTVISAAQDTSAIASSTTLLMLAMHKDIQQKVVDELHRVLGKTKEAPLLDLEELNELEYLEMVINEAMRLFPVVPLIFRINSEEIELTKGHILPIGTNITIPIYEVQRHKGIWGDDADQFRPERFSKDNIQDIHPYAYIPFAKGPRMCIGWKYALLLMKIQLTNILLRYEVDTTLRLDQLDVQLHITMNICQGYRIKLTERE